MVVCRRTSAFYATSSRVLPALLDRHFSAGPDRQANRYPTDSARGGAGDLPEAGYELATLHANGEEVPQNWREAKCCYEKLPMEVMVLQPLLFGKSNILGHSIIRDRAEAL